MSFILRDFKTFGKFSGWKGIEQFDNNETAEEILKKYNSLQKSEQKKHPAHLSYQVFKKVGDKLKSEAVEDFRIDLKTAMVTEATPKKMQLHLQLRKNLQRASTKNSLPPFIGIRIKPFTEEMKERGLRTLDIFLTTLLKETGGLLPTNFVVMLPKVTIPEQVIALVECFILLEKELRLPQAV